MSSDRAVIPKIHPGFELVKSGVALVEGGVRTVIQLDAPLDEGLVDVEVSVSACSWGERPGTGLLSLKPISVTEIGQRRVALFSRALWLASSKRSRMVAIWSLSGLKL